MNINWDAIGALAEGLGAVGVIATVFEHLVIASMALLYSAFAQYKRGLIPESTWQAYLTDWPNYINQPGFQKQWKQLKYSYPVEFVDSLDSTSTRTG